MKKILTAMICGTMLMGAFTPTLHASAQEESNVQQVTQDQKTVTEIQEHAQEMGIRLGENEIVVTDAQMEKLIAFMGYDLKPYKKPILVRGNGVTKIISKGKGSWDIYLSGTFLRAYYGGLGIAGGALVTAIVALSGGVLLSVAAGIGAGIAQHIKGEIKHGAIVRVRGWKVSSVASQ